MELFGGYEWILLYVCVPSCVIVRHHVLHSFLFGPEQLSLLGKALACFSSLTLSKVQRLRLAILSLGRAEDDIVPGQGKWEQEEESNE